MKPRLHPARSTPERSAHRLVLLLCWTTLLLVLGAPAQAQPAPPELARSTLQQLLEQAEQHSPRLQAASARIDAARAVMQRARFSPYTQFRAEAGLSYAPEARGTNVVSDEDGPLNLDNPWGLGAGVDLRGAVPLFTWGKLRSAVDAADAGVAAEQHGRERTQARLRYEVRRAYFGLQLALDLAQMISEGEGKLRKAVKRLEQRLADDDPDATDSDRWRLSATLAEIAALQASARELEASSRAALTVLTGADSVDIADCPSTPVGLDLDGLEDYRKTAELERPELGQIASARTARKAALDAALAAWFPDLALVLRAGTTYTPHRTDQTNPFVSDPGNHTTLAAGLVARWSLDAWGTHHKAERARAQLRETQALDRSARQGIWLEVTAAYHRVLAASESVSAWSDGTRDARAWFMAEAQAYQVGANTPRDLTDALKAYFKARGKRLDAIREYNTALAALERSVGQPLITDADGWDSPCVIELTGN